MTGGRPPATASGDPDAGPRRLFVGLPVADHARTLLAAAAAPAREHAPALTWTRPEGWHLTLAFLGEVPASQVPQVVQVVTGTAAGLAPLTAATGPAGRFGDHALWIGITDEPAGAIAELGARLQAALADAGLPVHRRPVRPHLTLARGGRRRAAVDDATVAALAPVTVHWEVEEVVLYRSVLGDGPARYLPEAQAPLGPASG